MIILQVKSNYKNVSLGSGIFLFCKASLLGSAVQYIQLDGSVFQLKKAGLSELSILSMYVTTSSQSLTVLSATPLALPLHFEEYKNVFLQIIHT